MRHKFASRVNRNFKYVTAAKTNIAATFARIRREQAQAAAEREEKLLPMQRRVKA